MPEALGIAGQFLRSLSLSYAFAGIYRQNISDFPANSLPLKTAVRFSFFIINGDMNSLVPGNSAGNFQVSDCLVCTRAKKPRKFQLVEAS
jgi:hypothetical protein